MIESPTPWRSFLYNHIATLSMHGQVLDLGGSRRSGYHETIKGNPIFLVANIEATEKPDILCDLEKGIPRPENTFDAVIALNVFEHIYNHQQLANEMHRVLKPGGHFLVAVPFAAPPHALPHDYFRYTKSSLEKIFGDSGFTTVHVSSIGRGPYTYAAQILYNSLMFGLVRYSVCALAKLADSIIARIRPKSNWSELYPLGFVVTGNKQNER